jgi:hypothetical protein
MDLDWKPDNRPDHDGHYAEINGKKFYTVTIDRVQRFPENRVISDLVDAAREGRKLDLNEIVIRAASGRYCKDELHELYRLIGYSISGFEEVFETDEISSDMWKKRKTRKK